MLLLLTSTQSADPISSVCFQFETKAPLPPCIACIQRASESSSLESPEQTVAVAFPSSAKPRNVAWKTPSHLSSQREVITEPSTVCVAVYASRMLQLGSIHQYSREEIGRQKMTKNDKSDKLLSWKMLRRSRSWVEQRWDSRVCNTTWTRQGPGVRESCREWLRLVDEKEKAGEKKTNTANT